MVMISNNLSSVIICYLLLTAIVVVVVRSDSVVNPGPMVIVEAPPAAVFSKKVYLVRNFDLELRCSIVLTPPRGGNVVSSRENNNNYYGRKNKNGNGGNNNNSANENNNGDLEVVKKFIKLQPSKVVWLKDGTPISKSLTANDDFVIAAQRLLLKSHKDSAAERLEGEYSCNATWSNVGSLLSPSITVHLAGFKKLRADHRPKVVYALPNNTVFVPCVVPESRPKARRIWFTKDNISDNSLEGNYVSETGMQLASTAVTYETQGFYTCFTQNPVNGQIKESKPVQLIIDNSTKSFSPIKVLTPEQKQTTLDVNVGDNVTLECVMIGVPSPSIVWEKYGGVLPLERVKQSLGNLQLINVTKSDEGTYLCKADDSSKDNDNRYHQQWPFIVYSLNVNEPVKVVLQIKKSSEYDKAWYLKCESSGGKATDLRWYFNGRLLLNKDLKPIEQSFDGGDNPKWSLTLKGPLMDGFYQCLVRSPNGDYSDSDNYLVTTSTTEFDESELMTTSGMEDDNFFLTTTDPFLPQIVQGPENATTFEKLSVTMVCQVVKEKAVIWLKDGSELKWGSRYSLIGSGTLEIRSASFDDKGWYTCLATNARGNASASAYLNVESATLTVGSHASDFQTDHYVDQDEGDYGDDDKLLITDASNEIKVLTTPSPQYFNKRKKLRVEIAAPKVYRMSNTSVLLKWDMPLNEALPSRPQLFKVQYKKVKSTNQWVTLDLNLPDYSRSHSVDGLEPGAKYKFRIGVVFDNDLQAVSKSSPRFLLSPEPETLAPSLAPVLQLTKPLSPSAIEVTWEHPINEPATVEGFVINYRRLYAGAPANYQNETVIGGNTRVHVLTHLLPATPYEIKMVAFNSAGKSRLSDPVVLTTFTDDVDTTTLPTETTTNETSTSDGTLPPLTFLPALITTEMTKNLSSYNRNPSSSNDQTSLSSSSSLFGLNQETFLLIVGAVLGVILILTIILMVVCALKQKKKDKVVVATSKGKFRDASKRIYREQSLLKDKVAKDLYSPTTNKNLLKNNNLPPPPSVTGYATNGHIVNLYSNPLDTALDEDGNLDYNDVSEELNDSVNENAFLNNNKSNMYKNYLDVSVSCRSNSTSSQHSDRSKSNGSCNNGLSTKTTNGDVVNRSPLVMPTSNHNHHSSLSTSDAVNSPYLWTRGSSPRPSAATEQQRRSWNFSSSPPSSVIEAVDSRNYYEPQEINGSNKQFYTFKPERSPHHHATTNGGGGGSIQQNRRYLDPKKIRLSDGYHSDA